MELFDGYRLQAHEYSPHYKSIKWPGKKVMTAIKKRVVVGRNRRWRHLRDREKRKLSQRGTRYLIIIDFAIKAAFSVSKEDDTVIISTANWFYDLLSMLNGCHISLISTNFSSHFFLLCFIDVSHPQKMRGRRRSMHETFQ